MERERSGSKSQLGGEAPFCPSGGGRRREAVNKKRQTGCPMGSSWGGGTRGAPAVRRGEGVRSERGGRRESGPLSTLALMLGDPTARASRAASALPESTAWKKFLVPSEKSCPPSP